MIRNLAHLFLAGMPTFVIGACQSPTDAPANGPTPNESVVEQQLQGSQDAVQDAIENDSVNAAEEAGDDPDATPGQHRYTCKDGSSVVAVYDADDGTARLTIAGRNFALLQVDSDTGSKYRTDDQTLLWSVSDQTAELVRAPRGVAKPVAVACTAAG